MSAGPIASDGALVVNGERQRRAVAALVEAGPGGAPAERLADVVWDEPERPADPTPHLRTVISRLRRQLADVGFDAPTVIQSIPGGYRLGSDVQVDAWDFEEILTNGSAEEPTVRLARLDEALDLWAGDPYDNLGTTAALAPSSGRLTELRLGAEEERLEAWLDRGATHRALARGTLLVDRHPYRDRLHRAVALALYRMGRQDEALRLLDGHRRALRDELGLDPGPEVVALEQAILTHDPSLQGPVTEQRTIRGYRLLELIGTTGTAERHLATQLALDRPVVVTIGGHDDVGPEDVRRFHDEAAALARSRHPHLVRMLDYWRDPTASFVVSELPGRTLADVLASTSADADQRALWVAQVAAGLAALHEVGVVHGAVTADSVVVDDRGEARLDLPDVSRGARGAAGDDVSALAQVASDALSDIGRDGTVVPGEDSLTSFLREVATGRAGLGADRFLDTFCDRAGIPRPEVSGFESGTNPYPGLAAFDETTAVSFHGRAAMVDELVERCGDPDNKLTVVTGPSGSGKSSVVLAGLVPALRAASDEGGRPLVTMTMRPGTDPFAMFVEAVGNVATVADADLVAGLADDDPLNASAAAGLGSDVDIVLIIDQLEELFALPTPDDSSRFLRALTAAATATAGMRIVATLRADFFDRALADPTFGSVFRTAVVPLAPMSEDELADAIVLPARSVDVELEPQLVARLIADAGGEAGALPLLGVTLHELVDRRTSDRLAVTDYEQLGGLSGALIAVAEGVVDRLDEDELDHARQLFGRLVSIDAEHQPVRRRVNVADLLDGGIPQGLIDELTDARLLVVDRDPASRMPTVAVTHESVLARWPRVAEWLDEDRRLLHEHGQLSEAAAAWERDGRDDGLLLRGGRLDRARELDEVGIHLSPLERRLLDTSEARLEAEATTERRHQARRRRLLVLASVVALIALVAGGVALRAQRRADDEAEAARVAASDAERAAQEATELAVEAEAARAVADDERDRARAASGEAAARLLQQAALSSFGDRPELGLQLALAAVDAGGDDAERTLVDLVTRAQFESYLGQVEINACASASPLTSEPALAILGQADAEGQAELAIWDLEGGGPVSTLSVPASPAGECPALAPGGAAVAAVRGTMLALVDAASGQVSAQRDLGFEPHRFTWALDSSAVAVLDDGGTGSVHLLDPETLATLRTIELDAPFPIAIGLTSVAGELVVTSDTRPPLSIRLEDETVTEMSDPDARVVEVVTSVDGQVVAGIDGRRVLAWRGATRDLVIMALAGDAGGRASLSLSPDATRAATITSRGVEVFDVDTGQPVGEPISFVRGIGVVAFVDDETIVATASGGRIYRLRAEGNALDVLHAGIGGAIVSPDGRAAANVVTETGVRSVLLGTDGFVLDLGTTRLTHRPFGDGLLAVYESEPKRYRVWSGQEVVAETSLDGAILPGSVDGRSVRIDHELAVLSMRDRDGGPPEHNEVVVLDAATGDVLAAWPAPGDHLAEPLWPDRLLVSSVDSSVRVTSLEGETLHELGRYEHPVEAAALAANGDLLLGLGDGSVIRHDRESFEQLSVQLGPPSNIMNILPFDGGFVAHHFGGEIVKWLDGEPEPSGTLYIAPQWGGFGAISEDERFVYIPDGARVVALPLGTDGWIDQACRRAGTDIDERSWEAITGSPPTPLTICS